MKTFLFWFVFFFPARFVPWTDSLHDSINNGSGTVERAVQGRGELERLRQPKQYGSGIGAMTEYITTEQT